MHRHLKRTLLLTIAVVFIIVGVAGLVLPFVQGLLCIAIGLMLLSLYSPATRLFMDKHTVRYPKLHKTIREVEGWVVRIIGRP